jgi:uncharacterized protein YcfJ
MNKTKTFALLAAGMVLATAAQAGSDQQVRYDYAKVTRVTPITRSVEVSSPHRECWDEQVVRREGGEASPVGTIIGGIAGGAVGNRFGGGNGRKAATVAGAVLGAALGNSVSRGQERSYTSTEQRCETVYSRHTEERVIGYDVSYRYNGAEYLTRTDRDPGERLRVRVSVTPML